MKAAIDEALHEEIVDEFDRIISSAYDAKECYLKKQYEDASGHLDEVAAARKKAEALVNEMWE